MEYFVNIIIIIMFVGSYVGIWFLGGYFGNKYKKNYNKSIQPEEEDYVKRLFEELKDSIISEDYEKSAKIRDELNKITKNGRRFKNL